ncbi:FumA C-terminus/TtdB family hydratase beta subunit [Methanolobus halotolerans]|uniref:Fumarate hydratase n=1 Tax=Methanolobus halotolerans TaxID=2052935 RepID=A0A4E0QTY3_9EURY|nr:FumA C-terminus/TtdB family hydratase beta subunit [Methanolobus halotolerans]TGC11485.1 fumarate hydratase [Methanolobus halotolerans]
MEYHLKTPLQKEEILKLDIGDVIYLTGTILTARDEAHARILELTEKQEELPFDLEGAVIYHCGPLVQKKNEKWEVIAAGPTTSARMSKMTPLLLKNYNVSALIGKGGMDGVTDTLKGKCAYLAFTGGCAALAAENIKNVTNVHWPDLGMPEAVWELEVENFGPLVVGIDAKCNDLFSEIEEKAGKVVAGLR